MSDFYGLLLADLFVIALVATLVHMGLLKIELKRPTASQPRRTNRKRSTQQQPGGSDDYQPPA